VLAAHLLAERLKTVQCTLSLAEQALGRLPHLWVVVASIVRSVLCFADNFAERREKKVHNVLDIASESHLGALDMVSKPK
jgi:hypothetical protein